MKKIISLILLFVLVVSSAFVVSANDEYGNLRALKIIPKEVTEGLGDELITRETFAYMAAKMNGAKAIAPLATAFSDVDETNAYSGYINYLVNLGVLSGSGDGNFNPKDNVSMGAASKIIVTILGYGDLAEQLGGFAGGYEQIAQELKLHIGVETVDGFLTKDGAVKMIDNALSAPMASKEHYVVEEGLFSNATPDKEKTILNDVLKVSAYSAFVDEVNTSRMSMSVTIIKNKYASNNEILLKGQKATFTYDEGIEALAFRYAPVTIMVDEEGKVVGIDKSDDVDIVVACISSVNGNNDRNTQPYKPSAIERLTILDDETEYDISEELRVYHNNALTESSVYLVGKSARLVIDDGEVVSIETWDLSEGGMITGFSGNELVYTKGNTSGLKIRNFDTYKNKFIYIDGKSATEEDIKLNTIFDYYVKDDTIVMIISEKIVVDTLYTVSSNNFEIGDFVYSKGAKVYYKNTTGEFRENADFSNYLNKDIKAYVAPDGNVLYIEPFASNVSNENIFFALVCGFETEALDEDIVSLKLIRFRPQVENGIFKVTEKTAFYDGLSREIITQNAGKIASDYVYEFEVNTNGNVISVRKAKWFAGHGERAERSITSFIYDGTAMVSVNSKMLYFRGVPLTFVYDGDDGITAKNLDWSQIYGNTCKATISFFVHSDNEYGSLPDLVFVFGDGVATASNRIVKYGIISDKEIALNDEGEKCVSVTVTTSSGKKKYLISEETASKFDERAFITFQDGTFFAEDEIIMTILSDFSGDPSKWEYISDYAASGLHKGTVERIDNLRLWAKESDGTIDINAYHPSTNFFIEVNTQGPSVTIKNISFEDISYGDTVFYNLTGDGIKGVILVK